MTAIETHLRTAVRSIIWRIFGVILTIILTLTFGGDLRLALEMGITYNLIRLVSHYFHDRIWSHLSWGLTPLPNNVADNFDIVCTCGTHEIYKGTDHTAALKEIGMHTQCPLEHRLTPTRTMRFPGEP